MKSKRIQSGWSWIPTLYFAEGLPYVAVITLSVIMYKRLELSNIEVALYTSWLYLPWVIKPLWSPFVDMLRCKRWWITCMQLLLGAGFAGVAFTLNTDFYLQGSLAFFWLLAFSSATHDIAADGFYMMGLDKNQQAFFVGIRNTFYRLAMIAGQGGLVIIAGKLETSTGNIPMAWSYVFYILAALFIGFGLYHKSFLPKPADDQPQKVLNIQEVWQKFRQTWVSFFLKPGILPALFFMLTYRLGESQLVKMASPFMLDPVSSGGLGLSTESVGTIYGTVGVIALTLGGILGGIAVSCKGFRRWLWPMAFAINIPNIVYIYLAYSQPDNLWLINASVAVEQLGYGFGFTAYTLFLMSFAEGEQKTAHYAICTAFMAMGMMLPGMLAGYIQDFLGYARFFIWIMICTIPGFLILPYLKIRDDYGKK